MAGVTRCLGSVPSDRDRARGLPAQNLGDLMRIVAIIDNQIIVPDGLSFRHLWRAYPWN